MPTNSSLSSSNLKFGMWNIEGLNHDKINDSYFNDLISNLHTIRFVEPWSDGSQDLSLPGFDLIHRTSRKRDKKKQGIIPVESLSTLNTDIAKVSSH